MTCSRLKCGGVQAWNDAIFQSGEDFAGDARTTTPDLLLAVWFLSKLPELLFCRVECGSCGS